MNKRARHFVFGVLLLCSALSLAQADKVDDYLKAEMEKRQIPGCSVAVVREGKVVVSKGYGKANVELGVPATPETMYQLASVTKQFTATAIMMLVEEGKLHLDDKVTSLLTDLPSAWSDVTVRHLLNHTSGIKSYTDIPAFGLTFRKDFTHSEIVQMAAKEPMDFKPGEKWHYNNTGFFLLGMIIEKVSGKPYGDFLTERIFKPLDMSSTRVNDLQRILPNRAQGYTQDKNGLRNGEYVSPTQPFAAGALVSNVVDMAKWDAALAAGKLLQKSSFEQMWTPTKLSDGTKHDYGFGWGLGNYRGHKLVEHGGGIPGFSTNISRFLDDKLTVITLVNADFADAGALAKGIAAIYLNLPPEAPEKAIEDKDKKTTERLEALFRDITQGKIDKEAFTPEAQKELIPKIEDGKERFETLGEFKSLTLLESRDDGKGKRLRYRAAFEKQTLIATFILSPEGKIAGIGIRSGD